MFDNLIERELANLEDNKLHRYNDASESKRSNNHRKLAARRAIEDHLEHRRLRNEFWESQVEMI